MHIWPVNVESQVRVLPDLRLDSRWLDLRVRPSGIDHFCTYFLQQSLFAEPQNEVPAHNAILRIQARFLMFSLVFLLGILLYFVASVLSLCAVSGMSKLPGKPQPTWICGVTGSFKMLILCITSG